jgi:coproporphyrinogen III oxidase-like Fe-S oxidoreductase
MLRRCLRRFLRNVDGLKQMHYTEDFLQRLSNNVERFSMRTPARLGGASKKLSMSETRDVWERFLLNQGDASPSGMQLYIHIPFCVNQLCSFCMYGTHVLPEASDTVLEQYLDKVAKVLRFFSPTFHGIQFRSLYIGGGTPSILSDRLIERLLVEIHKSFQFTSNAEMTFECSPSTISKSKLQTCHSQGINRISIGVQSLDKLVMQSNNRTFVTGERVVEILENAAGTGFRFVNLDLLAGIQGQTSDKLVSDFLMLALKRCSSITIYIARLVKRNPACTDSPDRTTEEARYDEAFGQIRAVRDAASHTPLLFHASSPEIREDNPFKCYPDEEYPLRQYFTRPTHAQGISTLGIGSGSNSFMGKAVFYEQLGDPMANSTDDPVNLFSIYRISEQKANYMANRLYEGMLDPQEYLNLFGTKMEEEFSIVIDFLRQRGWLEEEGTATISLSAIGLRNLSTLQYLFYPEDVLRHFASL